jgi:predicted DNA-binding transcriptional regulator AlpA
MNRRLGRAASPRRGLAYDDAVAFMGITHRTFDQMVNDGRLPKAIEVGDERVWDLDQLDKAFSRLSGLARNPWD